MRPRKRTFDIFSLSFLDVMSCGFGAVILLVLISDFSDALAPGSRTRTEALLEEVLEAETVADRLRSEFGQGQEEAAGRETVLARLRQALEAARKDVETGEEENRNLADRLAGLTLVEQSVRRAAVQKDTAQESDEEVGGIPVDSDYVVFIVDTSGSMQAIWSRVTRELENVISIHPKVKGFQILNDNGVHLLSAYEGRWIPDTPGRRRNVVRLFKTWKSTSNSSPVEGLRAALQRYARPGVKLSIYIFGDDYSGKSYNPVIEALTRLNTNAVTGKRLARVHAVGFISPHTKKRFPILMREVTRQNGGTFLALPVR